MLQFEKCAKVLFWKNRTFQEFVDFDQFFSGDNWFLITKLRSHVKGKKYNKKLNVFYKQFLNKQEF